MKTSTYLLEIGVHRILGAARGFSRGGSLAVGFALYAKRLQHYASFDTLTIPSKKNRSNTKEAAMQAEAKEIQKKLIPSDLVLLLDS